MFCLQAENICTIVSPASVIGSAHLKTGEIETGLLHLRTIEDAESSGAIKADLVALKFSARSILRSNYSHAMHRQGS